MNALMYAALALLIYIAGTEKFDAKNFCATRLLWIFFALWWCLPEFFQTTLWLMGACNYLWMAVGGLLAGWSNESGGAILILLTFAALERTTFNLSPKIFSAALTVWLVTIVYAVGVDLSVHSQMSERYEYVDAHKHDALIVVEPIDLPDVTHYIHRDWTPDEYARFYGDLTPYRDDFNNRNITYAQYYGVNEIILNEASWKKLQMFTLY